MAVTAHYIIERAGRLELKTRLIAFKRLEGAHDGTNLGDAMLSIIKEWGILHKACHRVCTSSERHLG
jgi:hypothetical protein